MIDPKLLMKKSQIRIIRDRFTDLYNDLVVSMNNPSYLKNYIVSYRQNVEALDKCIGFILAQKQLTKQNFCFIAVGHPDRIKEILRQIQACLDILLWIKNNTNQTDGVSYVVIDLYDQNLFELKQYSILIRNHLYFLDDFFFRI